MLQTISTVKEVLDILGHDGGDITQLIIQLVQVLGGAAVLVQLLCALNESVEFNEGIGTESWGEVL